MDTFDTALLILRLGIGLTFAAHGAQKLFGWWGGPGLAMWRGAMEQMGFRPASLFAWVSALAEFGGGLFLALGLLTPLVGAVLIAQSVVIIGQVHLPHGFFNAKGGIEFPLTLAVGTVALTLSGAGSLSVDAGLGLTVGATASVALVGVGIVAGLVTLWAPRLTSRRPVPQH